MPKKMGAEVLISNIPKSLTYSAMVIKINVLKMSNKINLL